MLVFQQVPLDSDYLIIIIIARGVRAEQAHSLLDHCTHVATIWKWLFSALVYIKFFHRCACSPNILQEKGLSRINLQCIWLAINHSVHKLVGGVAATVETKKNQCHSRRQRPKLTIFPPRSDWVAKYKLAYVKVSVDLTLTPRIYRTILWARLQHGGRRSLWHQLCCFQPTPWLRMVTKESTMMLLHVCLCGCLHWNCCMFTLYCTVLGELIRACNNSLVPRQGRIWGGGLRGLKPPPQPRNIGFYNTKLNPLASSN